MALAKGKYYQRSIRVNGKVKTRYYGGGAAALLAFLCDQDLAAQSEEIRRETAAREAEQRGLCRAEGARGESLRKLVTVCLESSGFIRYRRNPWKKRRIMGMKTP